MLLPCGVFLLLCCFPPLLAIQDTDGAPVGVKALPSHNVVAFDNVSVSSTGGASGGYREGIPVEEVMRRED